MLHNKYNILMCRLQEYWDLLWLYAFVKDIKKMSVTHRLGLGYCNIVIELLSNHLIH